MSDGFWYLAGPMRGFPDFNFPAFKVAAAELRARGYNIVSPAEKDEAEGFDWTGASGSQEDLDNASFDLVATLQADIAIVADTACHGVICLPGWENSSGARAETAFAWAIGKRVLRYFEPSRSNGFVIALDEMLKPDYIVRFGDLVDEWEEKVSF